MPIARTTIALIFAHLLRILYRVFGIGDLELIDIILRNPLGRLVRTSKIRRKIFSENFSLEIRQSRLSGFFCAARTSRNRTKQSGVVIMSRPADMRCYYRVRTTKSRNFPPLVFLINHPATRRKFAKIIIIIMIFSNLRFRVLFSVSRLRSKYSNGYKPIYSYTV